MAPKKEVLPAKKEEVPAKKVEAPPKPKMEEKPDEIVDDYDDINF